MYTTGTRNHYMKLGKILMLFFLAKNYLWVGICAVCVHIKEKTLFFESYMCKKKIFAIIISLHLKLATVQFFKKCDHFFPQKSLF